jgi:hypothetical protein
MVIFRTQDNDLRIENGAKISINSIGDVSAHGYARPEDKPKNGDDPGLLTTLCIVKGDYVRYAFIEGTVEVVDLPKKGVRPRAARSE